MPYFVYVEWRSNELRPTHAERGLDRRRRESRLAPETARLSRNQACKSFEAQAAESTARARSSQQKIDYSFMLPGIIRDNTNRHWPSDAGQETTLHPAIW